MTNTVFEEAEFADQVVIGQVDIWSDTLSSRALVVEFVTKFWEEPSVQLSGDPETGGEGSTKSWGFHPSLSEQRISKSSLPVEWSSFPGSECSNCSIEHQLSTLENLIFLNFLSTFSVITVLGLNALDLEFTLFYITQIISLRNKIYLQTAFSGMSLMAFST